MHMRKSACFRPSVFAFLLAVPLALAVSSAWAQARPEPGRAADRATLPACLRDSTGRPESCIGTIVIACLQQQDGPAAARDIACARREQSAWRERLEVSLQAMGRVLDSGQRARLAALQRGFESYTAEKCAFMADLATPARSGSVAGACDLREIALRSLELERQARRLLPAPGPSSGPRLER